jgi:predicted RNase H-like nuclease (RuvC/YqgF family)
MRQQMAERGRSLAGDETLNDCEEREMDMLERHTKETKRLRQELELSARRVNELEQERRQKETRVGELERQLAAETALRESSGERLKTVSVNACAVLQVLLLLLRWLLHFVCKPNQAHKVAEESQQSANDNVAKLKASFIAACQERATAEAERVQVLIQNKGGAHTYVNNNNNTNGSGSLSLCTRQQRACVDS